MSTIHHIWQPASHEDRSPSPRISRTDQCQFRFQLRAGVSRARTGSVARVAVTLAAIGAMSMLLDQLDQPAAAARVMNAIQTVTGEKMQSQSAGRMGYSTSQVGDLVVEALSN